MRRGAWAPPASQGPRSSRADRSDARRRRSVGGLSRKPRRHDRRAPRTHRDGARSCYLQRSGRQQRPDHSPPADQSENLNVADFRSEVRHLNSPARGSRARAARNPLGVFLHHPARAETRRDGADRFLDDRDPAPRDAAPRRARRTPARLLPRAVDTAHPRRRRRPRRPVVAPATPPSITQPFAPLKPSAHQPSPMLRCGTPLIAAFMPLVPLASSGLRGVFSHTSHPCTRKCATCRS